MFNLSLLMNGRRVPHIGPIAVHVQVWDTLQEPFSFCWYRGSKNVVDSFVYSYDVAKQTPIIKYPLHCRPPSCQAYSLGVSYHLCLSYRVIIITRDLTGAARRRAAPRGAARSESAPLDSDTNLVLLISSVLPRVQTYIGIGNFTHLSLCSL